MPNAIFTYFAAHLLRKHLAIATFAALALSVSGAVQASEICRLMDDGATRDDVSALPDAPETCDLASTSGGTNTFYCAWGFEYRNAASQAFFEHTSAEVAQCAETRSDGTTTAPVNHPDTHLVHQYDIGESVVTVSLKDKAAQKRTYVFLTVRHEK